MDGAFENYVDMAKMLDSVGFNLNFGTVVDINVSPKSPAIGKLRRSYSHNPSIVSKYAEKMIDAHRQFHVVTALKHFQDTGLPCMILIKDLLM